MATKFSPTLLIRNCPLSALSKYPKFFALFSVIDGFGMYTAHAPDHCFQVGEPLYVYVEVRNFVSQCVRDARDTPSVCIMLLVTAVVSARHEQEQ